VDLERRQVWTCWRIARPLLRQTVQGHPEIEVVSRDRAGLYADAARQGAPQARQIADRFHLLNNFRETIERQLGASRRGSGSPCPGGDDQDTPEQKAIERLDRCSDVAAHERLVRRGREATRQAMFDEIRHSLNLAVMSGYRSEAGSRSRRVERWVRRIDLPELNVMAPKLCTRLISRLSWHEAGPKGRPKSPSVL